LETGTILIETISWN